MAKKQIKKDIEEWLESDIETAFIEVKKVNDDKIDLTIGEDEKEWSLSYPKDYPKSKDKFSISSDNDELAEWKKSINTFASGNGVKLDQLLTKAAEVYHSLMGGEEEEDSNELEDEDNMGLEEVKVEKKKEKKSKEEAAIEEKEFLPIGSPAATMRLIKDLKAIAKGKPQDLGFSAAPVIHQKSGMENLYHWNVKLFGFDKDSELFKDMEQFRKKTGQDHILIELRFSKDYPFAPPFVRVIRPRFAFRTGHVTMGGSICMELLTNSGWNSTNDIESILIQIRAEMLSGGARLDAGMSGNYEYSESEAWDAFFRAASTHGWNVNGLSKDKFPLTSEMNV